MADVTLDLQNENPKELYGQGIRAYVLQDYETAVKAFSTASELLSAEHKDELHDSLGNVYLYYGKALLELSRKEGGPLGEGVPQNAEESGSEEETNEVGGDQEIEEAEDVEDNQEPLEGDKVEEEAENSEEVAPDTTNPPEEDLSDLQVAWEVLELAKTIFTKRDEEGRKNLAETLIVLGEISLESGNYPSAIEDMSSGLEIQKKIFASDSRAVAETLYKLGGAYATEGKIDDAIKSFTSSLEYLENRIKNLQQNAQENEDEIKEIKELLPEVEEKVADMKSFKEEIAKKVALETAVDSTTDKTTTNGSSEVASASSSKQATDISHLVKRKRKSDELAPPEEKPAKKPSP